MKIKYQNVGSLRNAEVEFNLGKLILIRGETNQGKSLLFYSFADALLNNSTFKRWLNNKAVEENSKAYQQITLIDDYNNQYEIKGTQNSYQFRLNNDEPFEKVRGKTVFDLINRQIFGFLFSADEQNPLVNIVQENEGFFPINRSDSQIYKTYERLLSLTSTQEIMRAIKFDIDDVENQQKDKVRLIQQYQEQQTKISNFLCNGINQNKLDEIQNTLTEYYNRYNKAITLYNSVGKSVNYISILGKYTFKPLPYFDIQRFNRLLNLFVEYRKFNDVKNLMQIELQEVSVIDIEKINQVNQTVNKVIQLQNEINQINEFYKNDSKALEDINLKLKDVKVCPLCGKPMEACDDETIHSK